MEDKILNVDMQIKVTGEDVDDIMTGALDGGITYWCDKAEPVGDYLGKYASDQISRGGKLMLYDFEAEEDHCLDLEKLMNGIKLWAKNPVGPNCLKQTDGKLVIDCCNADAVVCDTIVQYALFGNVIYG